MEEKFVQHVAQKIHRIWELIELFFETKLAFWTLYNKYEREVLHHAEKKGVHREKLRLGQEEVAQLIDFSQLVRLRNEYLRPLKELSHEIFRQTDSTDPFDRWVNSIFHEISILKEEHYKVQTIAAEYEVVNEADEFLIILDEVHEAFPRIIHHVHSLFEKATRRMEDFLPQFNQAKVLIRSVYLFGGAILPRVYQDGMEDFYEKIYPELGPFEGYVIVAQSFLEAGFYTEASQALQQAEKYKDLCKEYKKGTPQSTLRYKELAAQFSKLQRQCNQVNIPL